MRARADALADELREDAPPVAESRGRPRPSRCCEWLADDNFTFLGYREYDLIEVRDETDEDGPRAARRSRHRARHPARRPARVALVRARSRREVRAKVREKHLLVLTKANSRSTVHRRAYLDYVGIKRFDANGEVDGERRFLGLFTANAYTQSVRAIPFLRAARSTPSWTCPATRRDSHNGKDLLQFLETYPRDELFQMTPDEILPIAMQVLHIQERRQVRVFLRARRVRPVRLVPRVPAARPLLDVGAARHGPTCCATRSTSEHRRLHGAGVGVDARAPALRRARPAAAAVARRRPAGARGAAASRRPARGPTS